MLHGLMLKTAIFLLLSIAIYAAINTFGGFINNRINDYITTKETLMAKEIEVVEIKARNDYLNQLAEVTETFQQEKNTLMATTHQSLVDARTELYSAQRRWEVEDVRRRAGTPAGNTDLTARAARATYRKKEELEALSNWDTVYVAPVPTD